MTEAQKEALALLQEPGGETVDKGPAARAAQGGAGMRPAPKPDEVELASTAEKPGLLRQAFPRATERSKAEDPIAHDPLAGAIVQGIPAAGAGMLAGAAARALAPAAPLLSRMATGAAGGAAFDPEHPVRSAALGAAIPGVPGAVGAADNAIGEAALQRVTAPAKAEGSATLARGITGAAGAMLGHKIAGPVGAELGGAAGVAAGKAVRNAVRSGVDSMAERLAARHMARLEALGASGGVPVHIPEEVTVREPYVPIQKTADAKVAELETNAPFQAPDTLREDVIRDAAKFRAKPYSYAASPEGNATRATANKARPDIAYAEPKVAPAAGAPSLEEQLQRSTEILGDLRVAKQTGTLTPKMVEDAVKAGIPSSTVYHVVGDKAAAHAAVKKLVTGE